LAISFRTGNDDPGSVQTEALDDLVQRLAVAKYALAAGDAQAATDAVDAALALARKLLSSDSRDSLLRSRATD
jgi:hypothetical protein